MTHAAIETIEREGWRLHVADAGLTSELRNAAIAGALEAARGALGAPKRRSRHASTWPLRIAAGVELEIYIKLLDAPRGLDIVKGMVRGWRVDHVARITQALNDSGFAAPPLVAYGRESASGREIMVTPRAEADGPLRTLRALRHSPVARKRVVLRALGAEIARLHRCGFVHGDLTPFNILIVRAEPPRFVLIDHERTGRAGVIAPRRQKMRNLVQLGRFDLPRITTTDRMRVVAGYTAMIERDARRAFTRRLNAMIVRRIRRDGIARTVKNDGEWAARTDRRFNR
jgi:lipopolysaccharide kinase (Kdo/WaaP) family protein